MSEIPSDEELAQAAGVGESRRVGPKQRPGRNDEIELPALVTASDLLNEEDVLASLPREPADSETPPDPTPLTDKMHGPRGTPERDEWDATERRLAEEATAQLAADPRIQQAMAQEDVRLTQKEQVQAAFLEAFRKRQKESR